MLTAKELGARLRECRRARGLSLTVAAELCGMTRRTLRRYESGLRNLSVVALVALADLYHVRISDIVMSEEETTCC